MDSGSCFSPNVDSDTNSRIGTDPDRKTGLFEPTLYHHHGRDKLSGLESPLGRRIVVPKISPEPHIASKGGGSGK
ncbi:MAG: hypothetical protein COB78_08210 [Hyphomicrobiales bacterium]|nr:MAG: hypothetical protein COB78_08210 [Hyphomicrobiales bacterium]